jgi:hypothetical protein
MKRGRRGNRRPSVTHSLPVRSEQVKEIFLPIILDYRLFTTRRLLRTARIHSDRNPGYTGVSIRVSLGIVLLADGNILDILPFSNTQAVDVLWKTHSQTLKIKFALNADYFKIGP